MYVTEITVGIESLVQYSGTKVASLITCHCVHAAVRRLLQEHCAYKRGCSYYRTHLYGCYLCCAALD